MNELLMTAIIWAMGLGTGLGLGTAIATTRLEKKYWEDLFSIDEA
jgi:hypothetical protein